MHDLNTNISDLVPLLSNDIVFSPLNNKQENGYLLHQNKYNYYLKISKTVYQLLQLVDGVKTINEISSVYNSLYNDNISDNHIYKLLYTNLSKYGILRVENYELLERPNPNYLKLRFTILQKNYISGLTQILSFLFKSRITPILFFILLIFVSFNFFFNLKNTSYYLAYISPGNLSLYLILSIISALIHEIGHLSALKSFNLNHGNIGFGFYLLMPVLYSDVTEAWKLKNKDRLKINIGGIYFELILSSLLIIIYLLTGFYDMIVVVNIIVIKSLYNLNPLVRSDGYWILSDTLNIPNLRKNSYLLLKNYFKDIFSRRKKIYSGKDYLILLYALVSFLFTFLFLLWVIVNDYKSVLFFPVNIYNYFKMLIISPSGFMLKDIVRFILPTLFYYLVIKLILHSIRKFFKSYIHINK